MRSYISITIFALLLSTIKSFAADEQECLYPEGYSTKTGIFKEKTEHLKSLRKKNFNYLSEKVTQGPFGQGAPLQKLPNRIPHMALVSHYFHFPTKNTYQVFMSVTWKNNVSEQHSKQKRYKAKTESFSGPLSIEQVESINESMKKCSQAPQWLINKMLEQKP